MTDDLAYRIALGMAKGMHCSAAAELLCRVGSAKAFFDASRTHLQCLVGNDADIFADEYRRALLAKAASEAFFASHNDIDYLTIGMPNFPTRLANCDDGPYGIFKLGSCGLNMHHSVGIVGTRHATAYGTDFTTRLVNDLAQLLPGTVIVSGLAYGIDVAAHKAALSSGLPTVAVLAHGLSTIYPADHRSVAAKIVEKGGALVTEYTSPTKPMRGNFLARNRIIAGLCDCLVVVESDYRGGSMSTARMASLYGREVMALPGRINDTFSRGTNRLIANNTASLITCAKDLTDIMGWQAAEDKKEEAPRLFEAFSPELQVVYDFIVANPDLTINDMSVRLGLKINDMHDRLFRLEMKDAITSLPGGRYAPTTKM